MIRGKKNGHWGVCVRWTDSLGIFRLVVKTSAHLCSFFRASGAEGRRGPTRMSSITRLLFPGCPGCYFNSLPPSLQSPQGAANPIPSCRPRPAGGLVAVCVCGGGSGGQPAVRVPGQGSGSSLSQTMKHKPGSQGGEGGRAERMCPPGKPSRCFLYLQVGGVSALVNSFGVHQVCFFLSSGSLLLLDFSGCLERCD